MTAQMTEREAEAAQTARRAEKIDFKMITFSLAGKEYGVDIMNVKEIAKAGRFTYVPNALPFVRGVYNLRGDIISVIDLRIFFHLPAERKEEEALRLGALSVINKPFEAKKVADVIAELFEGDESHG
jgi:chemotaxis signal transduction protein